MQVTDKYTVATPGNWKNGDDVIIPLTIKDEEVITQKFPKVTRRLVHIYASRRSRINSLLALLLKY